MTRDKEERLWRFGFDFRVGGTHTARTMMLEDLRLLLLSVPSVNATKGDYVKAVIDDNCLRKRIAYDGNNYIQNFSWENSYTQMKNLITKQ